MDPSHPSESSIRVINPSHQSEPHRSEPHRSESHQSESSIRVLGTRSLRNNIDPGPAAPIGAIASGRRPDGPETALIRGAGAARAAPAGRFRVRGWRRAHLGPPRSPASGLPLSFPRGGRPAAGARAGNGRAADFGLGPRRNPVAGPAPVAAPARACAAAAAAAYAHPSLIGLSGPFGHARPPEEGGRRPAAEKADRRGGPASAAWQTLRPGRQTRAGSVPKCSRRAVGPAWRLRNMNPRHGSGL